jgi:hypothetical protein
VTLPSGAIFLNISAEAQEAIKAIKTNVFKNLIASPSRFYIS